MRCRYRAQSFSGSARIVTNGIRSSKSASRPPPTTKPRFWRRSPTRPLRPDFSRGVNGGIGTGKSFCLARFAELRAPIGTDWLRRFARHAATTGSSRVLAPRSSRLTVLDREAWRSSSDADARRALRHRSSGCLCSHRALVRRALRTGHVDVAMQTSLLLKGAKMTSRVSSRPPGAEKVRVMERRAAGRRAERRVEVSCRSRERPEGELRRRYLRDVDETTGRFARSGKLRDAASQPR